jgi:hypothetical protein
LLLEGFEVTRAQVKTNVEKNIVGTQKGPPKLDYSASVEEWK